MDLIDKVIAITEALLMATNSMNKKERDDKIKQIDELLIERERLIKQLKPPYSDAEKEKGRHLMELNQKLEMKLEQIQREIKQDLLQLKSTKSSTNKYTNPYQVDTIDGMFYDKRK
jgi:flagellar protein FliT